MCRALHVLPDRRIRTRPPSNPSTQMCGWPAEVQASLLLRDVGHQRGHLAGMKMVVNAPESPRVRSPSGRRSLSRSWWSDLERHLTQRVIQRSARGFVPWPTLPSDLAPHRRAQDAGGGGEIVGTVPTSAGASRRAFPLNPAWSQKRVRHWSRKRVAGNKAVGLPRRSWRQRAAVECRSAERRKRHRENHPAAVRVGPPFAR